MISQMISRQALIPTHVLENKLMHGDKEDQVIQVSLLIPEL